MSADRPKRGRRRRSEEADEQTSAEAGGQEEVDEARSSDEGPVAPQAGVDAQGSDEAQSTAGGSDDARSAEDGPVAPQAGVEEAAAESEGDGEPAADEEPAAADAGDTGAESPRRRRGSAETGGGRRRAAPRRAADGAVVVRAHARYVRCAPRKARLVVEHIRGKRVDEARAILRHTPRHAARDVLKLLESCVSNAENNHELVADELVVHQAYVDEGPTIRRYRPRAYGRATRINKRTSHMTVTLTPTTSKE